MNVPLPTEDDVLAAVSYDEARTTQAIADAVCGALSWPRRGTVRNRLEALEARGLVISDDERPVRWMRPEPLVVSTGDLGRMADEDARYDAEAEEREREDRADEHVGLDD